MLIKEEVEIKIQEILSLFIRENNRKFILKKTQMCPLSRETHMEPGLHTSRESGGKSSTHLGAQIYYACPKNNSKSSGELSDDVLLIGDPESRMLETKQCRRTISAVPHWVK